MKRIPIQNKIEEIIAENAIWMGESCLPNKKGTRRFMTVATEDASKQIAKLIANNYRRRDKKKSKAVKKMVSVCFDGKGDYMTLPDDKDWQFSKTPTHYKLKRRKK